MNVVMLGDFWQLHPVSGTYLASDPDLVPGYGLARNAIDIFLERWIRFSPVFLAIDRADAVYRFLVQLFLNSVQRRGFGG